MEENNKDSTKRDVSDPKIHLQINQQENIINYQTDTQFQALIIMDEDKEQMLELSRKKTKKEDKIFQDIRQLAKQNNKVPELEDLIEQSKVTNKVLLNETLNQLYRKAIEIEFQTRNLENLKNNQIIQITDQNKVVENLNQNHTQQKNQIDQKNEELKNPPNDLPISNEIFNNIKQQVNDESFEESAEIILNLSEDATQYNEKEKFVDQKFKIEKKPMLNSIKHQTEFNYIVECYWNDLQTLWKDTPHMEKWKMLKFVSENMQDETSKYQMLRKSDKLIQIRDSPVICMYCSRQLCNKKGLKKHLRNHCAKLKNLSKEKKDFVIQSDLNIAIDLDLLK